MTYFRTGDVQYGQSRPSAVYRCIRFVRSTAMRAIRKAAARKQQERKPTLSPTRISTYLDCAVKYKYIYQDKIGRFYLKARAGFSLGSTLHHVLQQFHE